ncbi:hypothetical protein [Acetobacter pasteurianus]|uniref:Uncharacterized protein n=2 Tax=Acetobacter pasteurianus TaxID=438 RepID=C7JF03_ACEP3|nr:hypothetical protein [Acetobacter pasteurianus]ASC06064.1 hypothetical protein S101468_01827 [Acetobacter pasteurianus subsp. pasteurianus]BAI00393.1 hypothetical protein APA01_22790 [Acetobacter pasteurianus IFO 3283-01]BAI03444.1 hypothetical protein APA03_22790 [Acetobacter pasteurianus IFO 3283-03]BAI06489.1 hypothetical protein APA07_22790 [Acetobacter pasteurianus IFO 3283-07]BAI09539.1 hypothetical protein APA22_22790 [Acetobacter pasteurianus IFO 3283-22]
MIAMQYPSGGSLLPIPVLFPMMPPSAARFGRRTPAPHDRPAALLSDVHGINRRGAVVWEMYTLPAIEDRLKNGIRLSDTFPAFVMLDDWIQDNFDRMSRAMRNCMKHGVPADAFYYPEILGSFVKNKDAPPDCLRTFEYFRDAIYLEIQSLLKSGRLSAYGKENLTDEKWQIIPTSYFSLDCKILFNQNKVLVEGASYLDVRVTCIESLPIWCAMIAYGDPEQVRVLMQLFTYDRSSYPAGAQENDLISEQNTFKKYFCALMRAEKLKGYYLDTNEQVEPALWIEDKVDLISSKICISPKIWKDVKVYTPHPPLNEADGEAVAGREKQQTGMPGLGRPQKHKPEQGCKRLDAPLLKEMKYFIETGQAKSLRHASMQVAHRADGQNTLLESRSKRLVKNFKEEYGPDFFQTFS